jgi:hypothetical protein
VRTRTRVVSSDFCWQCGIVKFANFSPMNASSYDQKRTALVANAFIH